MFFKTCLFLVSTVLVFCESDFVDNLGKCEINDGICQKDLLQSVLRDIAKTGVPSIGLPKIDPITLTNVTVSILDAIDLTLIQGTVRRIKDCIVNKFETNIEKQHTGIDLTCDVSIKGQYKAFSNSPLIKSFLNADTVHGEGNGKVKIEKLQLRFDFDFIIQRRNNELYIKWKPEKSTYKYNIKGKMVFYADNLFIGKQESSQLVINFLNQNWQLIMNTVGNNFMNVAVEIVYDFIHKFFDNIPARYYISTDLTPWAID